MWDVLLKSDSEHPDKGLWPRFLERRRRSGTLSPTFISDKKEHIATDFDAMIINLDIGAHVKAIVGDVGGSDVVLDKLTADQLFAITT
jgi:hypothetical protein